MKTQIENLLLALVLWSATVTAHAQGTAFTYQGRLNNGADPANGVYDLQFTVYDEETRGRVVGRTITQPSTPVSNGLFTVTLDFRDAPFTGGDRWLEIAVGPERALEFTTVSPRQKLTATPYAIYAGNVSAAGIAGQIADTQLSANIPRLDGISNHFTGTFTGNGAGISNLPAAALQVALNPVVAWGDNDAGQANVPARLSHVVAVAAGIYHSLALKSDGTVVAWGYKDNYDYDQTNVPAGLNNAVAVAAGGFHNLALKGDGTVVAWGGNFDGQANVPAGLNNVVAVAVGAKHSLALTSGGMVVAWGNSEFGQTSIPAGLSAVAGVAAGGYHNLAVKSNGTVVAWGYNGDGQTDVPAGLNNVVAVTAGERHSLALKSNGTVVAWGNNGYGKASVPAGLSNVVAVAAGELDSIALKSDGTVVAWGLTSVPASLNNVLALAAGQRHGLALRKEIAPAHIALLDQTNNFSAENVFAGNVGIGTTTPQQLLHLNVTPGHGEGMRIDSAVAGHAPAIYLNHTGPGGRNFRIASYGDNMNPGSFRIRDDTGGADRLVIDSNGNAGIGTDSPTNRLDVVGAVSATAFINSSDRNAKENFAPVSPREVLDKVATLPITTWTFKEMSGARHMGPMAQDFHAAFGLGGNNTTITTVDPDGVALAAIQGLNQKLEAQARTKDSEIAALKERLERLEKAIGQMPGDPTR